MRSMEWFTGLALLPALVCAVMMGGMALAGVLGWRKSRDSADDADTTNAAAADTTAVQDSRTPEDARR
jgi:hypothetical protein